MPLYRSECLIQATQATVFERIAQPANFVEVADQIQKVEFLSEFTSGVGTRFRETRKQGKQTTQTVLEITEFVQSEKVRFVADQGGTIWDTVYHVESADGQTKLSLEMEARPYKWIARLMTPWIMGMVGRAIDADLQSVKNYCESKS